MIVEEEVKLWFQLVKDNSIQEIEVFLEENPDVMDLRSGPLRHTAIFVVVKEREDRQGRKIIEMMVRKGADLNARNAMGQTPLFYAVAHDKPETCRYLIQQKVDVDIQDDFGQTAHEYASALGRTQLVSILQLGLKGKKKKLNYEESREEPVIDTESIPKLSFRLCKLTVTGKVVNITEEEMSRLEEQRPEIIEMLKHTQRIPDEPFTFQEDWRRLGLKIIDKLYNLSDSFWFRKCSQTEKIEKKDDLLGVDLEIIRLKLEHHIYQGPKQLRIDISTIVSNCQRRLGENHHIVRSARAMSYQFQRLADEEGYNTLISRLRQKK